MHRIAPALVALALLLVPAGCATPSQGFDARARLAGLTETRLQGEGFAHTLYWNDAALKMRAAGGGDLLHVYIDGDGKPWRDGRPSADPTSRNSLILHLIALDRAPAVLLGRPCFYGLADSPGCNSSYWNDARYSEPVVATMTAALGKLRHEAGAAKLVLFGLSGGGALAVLIADRVDYVDGIITVAADLDTKAWLAYHHYDGMKQSLNPAIDGRRHEAEHEGVFERDYAGGRDTVVPPQTMFKGLRDPKDLIVIPSYDHDCCWSEIWPQVLADADDLAGKTRGGAALDP